MPVGRGGFVLAVIHEEGFLEATTESLHCWSLILPPDVCSIENLTGLHCSPSMLLNLWLFLL